MTPELSAKIAEGKLLANWIAEEVHGLEVPGGFGAKLSGACFFVALDHHAAMLHLVEHDLIASAFALLRCQFEAYVRGCWLGFLASEEQVVAFVEGSEPPRLRDIIRDLEAHPSFSSGVLGYVKKHHYSRMSDFTHTGIEQASRNLTEEEIGRAYDAEEIISAIGVANSWALLVLGATALLASDETLDRRVQLRAQQMLLEESASTNGVCV